MRGDVDAAFALNRLDQNRNGLAVNRFINCGEVVVRHIREPWKHRLKSGVVLWFCRCGQAGVGPTVKTAFHSDDFITPVLMSISPRELDGGFIRFGPTVAKEALAAE